MLCSSGATARDQGLLFFARSTPGEHKLHGHQKVSLRLHVQKWSELESLIRQVPQTNHTDAGQRRKAKEERTDRPKDKHKRGKPETNTEASNKPAEDARGEHKGADAEKRTEDRNTTDEANEKHATGRRTSHTPEATQEEAQNCQSHE